MSNLKDSRNLLDEETVALVLHAFEQFRGARGFTKDEALQVLDWASQVEWAYVFLELIRKGKIAVDLRNDGEVTFWPIPLPTQH